MGKQQQQQQQQQQQPRPPAGMQEDAAATAAAAQARVVQLEEQVVGREALIRRMEAERDQLMEINNRLRHQLSPPPPPPSSGVPPAMISHGYLHVAAAGQVHPQPPSAVPQTVPCLSHQGEDFVAEPIVPQANPPPPPQVTEQGRGMATTGTRPDSSATSGSAVGAALSGIEAAMVSLVEESRGLRTELYDAQHAVGLGAGAATTLASAPGELVWDGSGGNETPESSGDEAAQRQQRRQRCASMQCPDARARPDQGEARFLMHGVFGHCSMRRAAAQQHGALHGGGLGVAGRPASVGRRRHAQAQQTHARASSRGTASQVSYSPAPHGPFLMGRCSIAFDPLGRTSSCDVEAPRVSVRAGSCTAARGSGAATAHAAATAPCCQLLPQRQGSTVSRVCCSVDLDSA
jgi:hypothetical protein